MTDLPPRTTPPRTDGRKLPENRTSQASMWIVLLVLAALIIAAVLFSMDRSDSVVTETPAATDTTTGATTDTGTTGTATTGDAGTATGTGTTTGTDGGTAGTDGTTPAEPAPPAPGTGGTTTSP